MFAVLFWLAFTLVILLALAPLAVILVVYPLSRNDTFFTIVDEGVSKALMKNGRFHRFVMSYENHRFRAGKTKLSDAELEDLRHEVVEEKEPDSLDDPQWGWRKEKRFRSSPEGALEKEVYIRNETDEEIRAWFEPNKWDIIPGKDNDSGIVNLPIVGQLLENVYWVGLWPLATVSIKNRRWVSWDYPRDKSGDVTSSEKAPIPHSESIDYELIQDDVYWARVVEAETREAVPVNVSLILTLAVRNPYKARFRAQNWIEKYTNSTEAVVRELIGQLTFSDLFENDVSTGAMLMETLNPQIRAFRSEYGIKTKQVEIQSMNPAGQRGDEYRRLSTLKYEADRTAEATVIASTAEKTKIENTTGTEADIEIRLQEQLGPEGYKWLKASNIDTYVEGGHNRPIGVNVGGNQKKSSKQAASDDSNKKSGTKQGT